MSRPNYPPEFKIEAVKQVLERGHRVAECPRRIKFDPPCRLNFDPGLGAGFA